MSGTRIAFDTNTVINLLDRHHDLSSLGINVDDTNLLTSVIVRIELLSKRNIRPDEERDILEFIDGLAVIPLNEPIEQKAIEIRRATSLKLPDSIIAATSIILDALLLTDDEQLLKLSWPGFRTQSIG